MFGTFWRKLVRRDAIHTSVSAAQQVKTTKMEKLVYETIKAFPDGASQDDILDALDGLPYSTVTARFSALLRKGLVYDTGRTKTGKSGRQQRIMKAMP